MLSRAPRRVGSDDGVSLLIAIMFVFAVGVWTVAIVQLAYPNLVTSTVVATNRGTNYDTDAALAQDVATIRYKKDTTTGFPYGTYGSACPNFTYPTTGTPTVTVVCTAKQLLDANGFALPYQREVQLQACAYGTSPCKVLGTADIYYYDDGIWGRAAFVSDWSTR